MKKLELDVAQLKVESFRTAAGKERPRGTVHGNSVTEIGGNSCYPGCGDTNWTDYVSCVGCSTDCSRRPGSYTCQTM